MTSVRAFKRRASWGLLAVLAGLNLTFPALAEPVKLAFRPPQIAVDAVCVARQSDAETMAFWGIWDGVTPPQMSVRLIKRDIKRLQHIDARAWIDTIEKMIDLLEQRAPNYAGKNALLTRIQARQAAGQTARIRAQRLVHVLAEDAQAASPRIQNALAGFFRAGIGVDQDRAYADQLLLSAGYSGNADALLTLSKRSLEGAPVAGWDVPAELAIIMAFGALVGELNDTICDRTARIAREYHSGEIVARDPELAQAWFRFGADLGDPNSAWKVAEYHLQSEELDKDNSVLIQYLTQAAKAGLPFAQIELGRIYEVGALVDRDLLRALALYRRAAAQDTRAGLTRLGLFLEDHADVFPELRGEMQASFVALSQRADAPGWVFTRLADLAIANDGRWGAGDEVRALMQQATQRGDLEGSNRYALALLAEGPDEAQFEAAVSLLAKVVSVHGGVTPSKQLFAAFMCQARDSPRVEEAQYWQGIEAATDTANVNLKPKALDQIAPEKTPALFAKLQSQALYGRPSSLASWLQYLETSAAFSAAQIAFWQGHAARFDLVAEARQKTVLRESSKADHLAVITALIGQGSASGIAAAAPSVIRHWANLNEATQQIILTDLKTAAATGTGAALSLLAQISPARDRAQIYAAHADVIGQNGDFAAYLFALSFVDPAQRDLYFARAVGQMSCDYKSARALAQLAADLDMPARAAQWLRIAAELTGENLWAALDLADAKLNILGASALPEALKTYEAASAAGDASARIRLFDLMILPEAATFDIPRAVEMLQQARLGQETELLVAMLGRYRRADAAVKTAIEAQLDVGAIFHAAAQAGDIYAMRSYGLFLRETAQHRGELSLATDWLRRAAEGGDLTAMSEYGQALAFGLGVTAAPDEAIIWLSRAADGGHKKAKEIIALVDVNQRGDG